MKKILLIVVVISMLISSVSCGAPDAGSDAATDTKSSVSDSETQKEKDTQMITADTTKAEDKKVWKISTHEIYVDYPSDWISVNSSGALVVMKDKKSMANVYYTTDSAEVANMEGSIPTLIKKIVNRVFSYCEGSVSGVTPVVNSTEKCTIGGFEGIKFTATITTKESQPYDCPVYGYCIKVGDVVAIVSGMVTARDQNAKMSDDINALVEQIAASIRAK